MSGRAIKFRVWSQTIKQWMNHCAVVDCSGNVGSHFVEVNDETKEVRHHLVSLDHRHDTVVEQFTGVLDRNGREIYEGDVVRWLHGPTDVGAVGYSLGGLSCYPNTAFYGVDVPRLGGICAFQQDDEYEILGNVHEHPHLLDALVNNPSQTPS